MILTDESMSCFCKNWKSHDFLQEFMASFVTLLQAISIQRREMLYIKYLWHLEKCIWFCLTPSIYNAVDLWMNHVCKISTTYWYSIVEENLGSRMILTVQNRCLITKLISILTFQIICVINSTLRWITSILFQACRRSRQCHGLRPYN